MEQGPRKRRVEAGWRQGGGRVRLRPEPGGEVEGVGEFTERRELVLAPELC